MFGLITSFKNKIVGAKNTIFSLNGLSSVVFLFLYDRKNKKNITRLFIKSFPFVRFDRRLDVLPHNFVASLTVTTKTLLVGPKIFKLIKVYKDKLYFNPSGPSRDS